jgi:hypothetical protein
LSNVDITDGFYRIWVQAADVPKLGVLLHAVEGQERLIAFPLVLPMGWNESPPIFTSATETITDLANVAIQQDVVQLAHRLKVVAETDSHLTSSITNLQPRSETPKWQHVHVHRHVGQWAFYVDDFIGMVQGGAARRHRVKRALLHSLDRVFCGLSSADGPFNIPGGVNLMDDVTTR